MGTFSKFHRFREAGESANVNNVERFGEPVRSLFTSTKLMTVHHRIEITDSYENVVYRAETKFPSLHDKTDLYDASGNHVAHMERKLLTLHQRQSSDIRYNLKGQRVDEHYKGIVVVNGKKIIVK